MECVSVPVSRYLSYLWFVATSKVSGKDEDHRDDLPAPRPTSVGRTPDGSGQTEYTVFQEDFIKT